MIRPSASVLLACALAAAGCVDHKPSLVTGTQSLQVTLIDPVSPGTPQVRLKDTVHDVTISVTAYDADGEIDTSVSRDVDLYVSFLGTFTPPHENGVPFQKITLVSGVSQPIVVHLPATFGATVLWVEDVRGKDASFATGTSPQLWFRDAYIRDIQTPRDPNALDALSASPLENKNVVVSGSAHGAFGRLVVNGVYATGFTVDDVACQDAQGMPPCKADDYDHAFVYSFSRPTDQQGRVIKLGETITGFQGAVSEYIGLTEINFPQTFVDDPTAHPAQVSTPIPVVDSTWFMNSAIKFEQNEAGLIEIDNGKMCAIDADFANHQQWKVDVGSSCSAPLNIITAGVINFDPTKLAPGTVIPKIVGTMRPLNFGGSNVWIVYPRFDQDLTLP
jgi:hypothetical protein